MGTIVVLEKGVSLSDYEDVLDYLVVEVTALSLSFLKVGLDKTMYRLPALLLEDFDQVRLS